MLPITEIQPIVFSVDRSTLPPRCFASHPRSWYPICINFVVQTLYGMLIRGEVYSDSWIQSVALKAHDWRPPPKPALFCSCTCLLSGYVMQSNVSKHKDRLYASLSSSPYGTFLLWYEYLVIGSWSWAAPWHMANRKEGLSVLIIIGCISFQHSFRHLGSLRCAFMTITTGCVKKLGLQDTYYYTCLIHITCVVFQGWAFTLKASVGIVNQDTLHENAYN